MRNIRPVYRKDSKVWRKIEWKDIKKGDEIIVIDVDDKIHALSCWVATSDVYKTENGNLDNTLEMSNENGVCTIQGELKPIEPIFLSEDFKEVENYLNQE